MMAFWALPVWAQDGVGDQASPPNPPGGAAEDPVILFTGFEPFLGGSRNSSWEAVSALDGRRIGRYRVVALRMPVDYAGVEAGIGRAVEQYHPSMVISFGMGYGGSVAIERTAVNNDGSWSPDNAGVVRSDEPVVRGAPMTRRSTLPIEELKAALEAAGLPVRISDDAGNYVCNHTFYWLVHHLSRRTPPIPAGFVHVPPPDSGMTDEQLRQAVEAIAATGARWLDERESAAAATTQPPAGEAPAPASSGGQAGTGSSPTPSETPGIVGTLDRSEEP